MDDVLDRPAIALAEVLPYVPTPKVWHKARPMGAEPSVGEVRELTAHEAQAARTISRTGNAPIPELAAIRARHHELARLMAAGQREGEISKILGMSVVTISHLKRSPAFQALLAHYMAMRDSEALGVAERIAQAGLDVVLLIQDRLQQEGASDIPISELRKLAETFLDRSGHSPVQKNINISAGLSARDLEEIRNANAPGKLVDVTPAPKPEPPARLGPPHGGIDFARAVFPEDEGDEGGGAGV